MLKYLTCLSDSRIPLTNNQAERSLRHLVLKRKNLSVR
ncbi:MAG: transposase [Candidatus Yonathbacteria bacterium]|nr:transposase [Candidatus Yonathbacteria bacterium]